MGIIDANVGGGIHLEARQTPNSLGGRTINILTSKAGVEMLTYHADTSKVDTAAMLKLGLKGELTLNPESILYRTVVSQYQFLTPFRTRSSDHAGAKWKGFKISKTGNGNEREIEWNGRKLGSGDYTLTDNSFSTTQSLANGKSLTTTITWKNKPDTVAFLLDNAVTVKLDGTERRLDLNMEWGMNKVPDMNFNTAENGHFKAT